MRRSRVFSFIVSELLLLSILLIGNPALATPPSHDNLRDALRIDSLPFRHQAVMGDATNEVGEPPTTCGVASSSAWYRYDSVNTLNLRASTYGSSSDFILGVYKVRPLSAGFGFADLEAVACNDNGPMSTSQAVITFTTEPGKVYYFQAMTNAFGVKGALTFNLGVVPANDSRSNALDLATMSLPSSISTLGAETDDTSFTCAPGGSSVWFKYSPTTTTHVKLSTTGANFQVVVQVVIYIGAEHAVLECNKVFLTGAPTVFRADTALSSIAPGASYLIQIGGYAAQQGTFNLDVSSDPSSEVAQNDDLAGSINIDSLNYQQRITGQYATAEFYEQKPCYMGTHTVWYSYTPSVNQRVNANTIGSDFDTSIAVYTGSSMASLTPVTCNDDISAAVKQSSLSWDLQAGVTYRFQVGEHVYSRYQIGSLSFELKLPTSNDDFENASGINSLSILDFTQTMTAAETSLGSIQTSEPVSCVKDKTFWWKLTPLADSRLTIDTAASSYPTAFAVYTGSSVSSLTSVSCSASGAATTFDANSGTTYYVQVGAGGLTTTYGDLSFRMSGFLVPVGDLFAKAYELSSLPSTFTGTTAGSSRDASEPTGCTTANTIWAKKTLPAGTYTVDTLASSSDTKLGVFLQTGSWIGSLSQVGCSDDHNATLQSQATFVVSATATYYFQVATNAAGAFTLRLQQEQVPANDAMAQAIAAGSEPGEQTFVARTFLATGSGSSCGSIGKDVWYLVDVPVRTWLRAHTEGSDFDTSLELYSSSGGNLTFLRCSDNIWPSLTSRIDETIDAGTYYLRVGGANSASGVLKLFVGSYPVPVHDLFEGAKQIGSLPYSDDVNTYTVETEAGEPDPHSGPHSYCGHVWRTVWYKFTPSASTFVSADIYGTQGNLFNTVIAVYEQTGDDIGDLQFVDCNNDNHNFGNGFQSSVAFGAEEDATYYFQIGGYWGDTGDLRFRVQSVNQVLNDDFDRRIVVPSLPFVQSTSTFDPAPYATTASLEKDEQQPCGGIAATIWYEYRPTTLQTIEVVLSGDLDSVIAIYRQSVTDPVPTVPPPDGKIACVDTTSATNRVTVPVDPANVYYIQIGGRYGDSGGMNLTFSQVPN